jgi:predicted transcriptional regulator
MEHGPLSINELAPFLKLNRSSLKECVNFLTDQGMIKEEDRNSIVTYSITKRGTKILRFFNVPTLISYN